MNTAPRIVGITALLFFCLLTGCSTVETAMDGANGKQITDDRIYTIPRVYSGVASDVAFIRAGLRISGKDAGLVFFDLPFSAVADIIILPYTLVTQSKHGNLYTGNGRSSCKSPVQNLLPKSISIF